ncbi:DUF2975 domain-containing protein [Lacticaseibacillus jixiensis]|uniref:DUF2975 domain-containing protein n=1 Tax=Lacticaseibacillus jixiensis TaxID=3231926 RepID=UPI0036F29D23
MKIRTTFLKAMLVIAGLVIALFAGGFFWRMPNRLTTIYHAPLWAWVLTGGLYFAVVCFFAALVCAWRLLRRVETDTAFTQLAVANLRQLKWCTTGITVGLALIMPQVFVAMQQEDAPGGILMASGLVALPLMVTIFLAVLEQLWAKALAYKTENELTI